MRSQPDTPETPVYDEDRFDEYTGSAETLTPLEPPDVDEDLERAIAAARRAGGVLLERTAGFVRTRRDTARRI